MLERNQSICPLNISFDYDWARVNNIFNHIVALKDQGKLPNGFESAYETEIYGLNKLGGSLISSTSLTGTDWDIWAGEFLEYVLPKEVQKIKYFLIENGLEFVNFGYTVHGGSIIKHIDGKRPREAVDGHCNINYIIRADDPTATTITQVGSGQESYPSIPGTTWLINSAVPHQVNNSGIREVFQIKVHSPYQQVRDCFIKHNMVI